MSYQTALNLFTRSLRKSDHALMCGGKIARRSPAALDSALPVPLPEDNRFPLYFVPRIHANFSIAP